jgi:hypothetical protein
VALKPLQAFLISFALGFISGFLFVTITLGLVSFLIPAQLLLFAQIAVALVLGVIYGILGLFVFYIGHAIGRLGLVTIAALLFILGIVFIQPEIDVFALIPLVFAFTSKKGRRR